MYAPHVPVQFTLVGETLATLVTFECSLTVVSNGHVHPQSRFMHEPSATSAARKWFHFDVNANYVRVQSGLVGEAFAAFLTLERFSFLVHGQCVPL